MKSFISYIIMSVLIFMVVALVWTNTEDTKADKVRKYTEYSVTEKESITFPESDGKTVIKNAKATHVDGNIITFENEKETISIELAKTDILYISSIPAINDLLENENADITIEYTSTDEMIGEIYVGDISLQKYLKANDLAF